MRRWHTADTSSGPARSCQCDVLYLHVAQVPQLCLAGGGPLLGPLPAGQATVRHVCWQHAQEPGGCAGVVVLAASSRPDLLDAALLRPGRLDRLLYCPFPDPPARAAILGVLAGRLPLQPGTEVAWLADLTDGARAGAGCPAGILLHAGQGIPIQRMRSAARGCIWPAPQMQRPGGCLGRG